MLTAYLSILCIGLTSGFRGPHHPRSTVSHHHYAPQKDIKLTHDTELLQDATHLKEDMGPLAGQLDFSKMSAHEREFYYFHVHDIDKNIKLDGLEILHAIQHSLHDSKLAVMEQGSRQEDSASEEQEDELPWIVELIDRALEADDQDNDGYLGYVEYVLGRQRDHAAQARRDNKQRHGNKLHDK